MGKTRNNSLRMQQAVKSIFEDYRQKQGCLGHVYEEAACGCNNALQMWRGPKGEKGEKGDKGDPGDHAGSFLTAAEFVVDPEGQAPGSYLKLTLRMADETETVIYVDLSELEDVYTAGDGIDIHSMVVAARLGAGLTFDNQGNITSAYQFCDGLDETSNVVKVKLDANNNILGFAGSGCKGLTATVGLSVPAQGDPAIVLTGVNGAVLNTIPLTDSATIDVQRTASGGLTWLVDATGLVSSTAGNQLVIDQTDNKLYVGKDTLSYTVGEGTFTLTHPDGTTSAVTVPTVVKSLERADMVCEGENAHYLHLTFKRDNGQNLYQDIDMSCLATAELSLDVQCNSAEVPAEICNILVVLYTEQNYNNAVAGTYPISNYDTITVSDPSSEVTISLGTPAPYAIGFEVQTRFRDYGCDDDYNIFYFSTNDAITSSIWTSPVYPIPLATLLRDGAVLEASYDSTHPAPISMSVVANQNGTYTISFVHRSEEPVLTADLVSGDNRVDMKPLLEHIGGKAETSIMTFPLYGPDIFDDGDNYVHQNGYEIPQVAYALGWCNFYTGTIEDMYNGNGVSVQVVSEVSQEDGTVIYTLSETPTFLNFQIYEVDAEGEYVDNIFYELGFDTSFTDILAAGLAGVTVAGYQYDPVTHLSPPIDKTVNLVITAAPGEHSYRFAISDGTVSAKLCLEPSCDPCIDLMPVVGDALTNVSGSFSCPTLVPYDHEQVTHAACKDANGNNILTGVTLTQTTGTNQYTVTFPSNAAKLLLMYNEVFDMDTNEPIYCRENTGFIDLSSIHVGDRFCIFPACEPLGD